MSDDFLEKLFVKWTLLEWWDTLLEAYESMGFTDKLDDLVRISEFNEIVKLLNEWISKVEKTITPYYPYDQDKGIQTFTAMKHRRKLVTRVDLVYEKLRQNWNDITYAKLVAKESELHENREEREEYDRDHYSF